MQLGRLVALPIVAKPTARTTDGLWEECSDFGQTNAKPEQFVFQRADIHTGLFHDFVIPVDRGNSGGARDTAHF
jgi:hypothetical protein